jgi:predicted RNase H-like HicB family nuclease
MASSTGDGDTARREIRLVEGEDWWVATDLDTGVASQGETPELAVGNLEEALALHRSDEDSIETPAEEREALRELGIDPDTVEAGREEADDLPEFMQ